jgi:exopolysaccharide production protein ExoQ
LILLAHGRSFLQLRVSSYYCRLLLFAVALYLGQTRGTLAALAVGIAVLLWYKGRTRPLARYLGLFYYGTGLLLVALAAPTIEEYLRRGGSLEALRTLNGRLGLWEVSIGLVNEQSEWITGFGYGAARVILPARVEWAGTAHSSWVELLMGLGILGVLLAAADVVFLLRHLSRRGSFTSPAAGLSLLAFLLISSIVTESLVYPGLGFGMLVLLHAPVLARLTLRFASREGLVVGPNGSGSGGRSRLVVRAPIHSSNG